MTQTQFNLAMTRAMTATWYKWTVQLPGGRKIVAYSLSDSRAPISVAGLSYTCEVIKP